MKGRVFKIKDGMARETFLKNGVSIATYNTTAKRHFEIVKSLNHYGNDAK
jgi:predicted nucleic acid-binding protein